MSKTEKNVDSTLEAPLLDSSNYLKSGAANNGSFVVDQDSGLPNVRPSIGTPRLLFESRQDSVEIPASSLVPVPPDGGWGWIIVFSSFVINMIVDGMTYSFGILLPEFLASLGGGVEVGALIGSLMVGFYLLVGPIVSGLVNRFGARPVILAGSAISSFAFFISYWADSLIFLMITFGTVGGIGCGLMVLPGIVYVSYYFERKRALATGLAVAGSGFGAFVFPPLTQALIQAFTWRGALWIFAGITLQCAVFGCLMRPLPTPKVVKEMKKQLSMSRSNMQASDWTLNLFSKDGGLGGGGLVRRKLTSRTESQVSSGFPSPRPVARHRQLDIVADADVAAATTPPLDKMSRVSSALAVAAPTLDVVEEEPEPKSADDRTERGESSDNATIRAATPPPSSRDGEDSSPPPLNRRDSNESAHSDDSAIHFKSNEPTTCRPNRRRTSFKNDDQSASTTPPPAITTATDSTSQMNASATDVMRPSMSRMISRTSRLSVRDFANNLNRFTSTNALGASPNASQANLAAMVDPSEFSKPFARQDILLTGSIKNLNAFRRSGSNLRSYRESIISIPRIVEFHDSGRVGGPAPPPELVSVPEAAGGPCGWLPFAVRAVLSQMLDRDLLRLPTMQLLCLSNFFGFLAFYVPFVYLASYAAELNVPPSQASLLLSVIGITNTLGRVLCGWAADKGWVRAIHVNNASLIACGFLTLSVPLCNDALSLNAYSALFGFFMAAFVCLTSIILVDHLGLQRLTNAFGLLILVRGFACLIGSPLAGYVFTLTSSYKASFLFSGALIVAAGAVSCLVPLVEKSAFARRKAQQLADADLDAEAAAHDEEAGGGRGSAAGGGRAAGRQRYAIGPDRHLEDIVEALAEYELSLSSKAGAKLLQNGDRLKAVG